MYDFEMISETFGGGFGRKRFPRYPWEGFDPACLSEQQVGGRKPPGSPDGDEFWPIPVTLGPDSRIEEYEFQLAVIEDQLARGGGTRNERLLGKLKRQRLRSFVAQLRNEPNSIPPEAGREYAEWIRGLREDEWKDRVPTEEDKARTQRAIDRYEQAQEEAYELRCRQRIAAGNREGSRGEESDPFRLP